MSKFINLIGLKFGKLTPIQRVDKKYKNNKGVFWLCKCDCGNETIVESSDLKRKYGGTKSCGCYRKEKVKIHGKSNTRLYNIWCGIKERCFNKKAKRYKDYGEKNITMCKEWKNDFEKFYEWSINNGYKDNLTIDRINNYDGYNPSNCRWITKFEQNQNRKHHLYVEYKGEKYNLAQLSRLLNIPYNKIYRKYNKRK